jgi:cell division protein FtsI (penicillin-binding protein 3)
MTNINQKKIRFIFGVFAICFGCVLFKAFQIQVIDNEDLITRSRNQIFRETKVYPKRGHIYDRNGSPLAINIQTYSIFTIPQDVAEPQQTYRKIASLIPGMSYQQVMARVSNRTRFTWLARKIELEKEVAEEIQGLEGVFIEAVPKRLYPNRHVLGQALGFVGVDNVGLSGIEFLFDTELRGEPRVLRYVRDNKGRPIKFESREVGSNAKDIHLTIDKDLQAIAEQALKDVVEEYNAQGAGLGIMDPFTGEILAIANYPFFDPNELRSSQEAYRRLSFVTDPFEPGSTFKTLTIASALENRVATSETNYYCEQGRFRVGNHVITEAESRRKYEWLTVEEILKYSSNVGTTKIAFDLTFPKLRKTLVDFGVGQRTAIQIPAESRGIFTENENIPPLSLSNISFGQGVATTGIQMLRAYAAFANGGYLVEPTIISRKAPVEKKRIMSEETARSITAMLVEAVENGTGSNAKIPYFTIAGKTGTAQRVSPTGGYEGYIPNFAGYAVDVDHPFVMYVYVDNPKSNRYYGNVVASPVFKKVAEYLLYKNREFRHLENSATAVAGSQIDHVQSQLSSARIIGKGRAPNFIGLDKLSAERISEQIEHTVIHRGIGVVGKQSPAPGEALVKDKAIILHYTPPSLE